MAVLNLRSANRAVTGAGDGQSPGPEGALTKLVMSELAAETTDIMSSLWPRRTAFMDGPGMVSGSIVLMHRDVDRRRHLGDQAQPNQVSGSWACPGDPLINN